MSSIKSAAGNEHEQTKGMLAKYMMDTYNYEITHMADAAPCPQPLKIGRHIPDILAEKTVNGIIVKAIGEAESCVGLESQDTKEQIEDYKYESSGYEFFLGVPLECIEIAKTLMKGIPCGTDKKNHLVNTDSV